jgi:hypothetical protein
MSDREFVLDTMDTLGMVEIEPLAGSLIEMEDGDSVAT